jgi:hypothetical protein
MAKSLRDKAREYEKGLCNAAAKVFRDTFKEQSKSTSAQKAFVAAKEAAAKIKPSAEEKREESDSDFES